MGKHWKQWHFIFLGSKSLQWLGIQNHSCVFFNVYSGGLVVKSCLTLVTPWPVACQAPLSVGFSRQEYWSRLPFPSPGNLPKPGIKSGSPTLQADLLSELQGKSAEPLQ